MGALKKISFLIFGMVTMGLQAQEYDKEELLAVLKEKDSLLFDSAFNSCGIEILNSIFTEDFEFYHDKGGMTEGRNNFVESIAEGCKNRNENDPQPAKRILVPNSLEVYPMFNNGVLYGAIQHGVHTFEFLNEKGEYQKGDIAKFTHIWILDKGQWKIKRELSYDHHLQQ